jgi:hypothetical protein
VLLQSLLVSHSVREFIDHILTFFLGAGVIGDITTAREWWADWCFCWQGVSPTVLTYL